MTILWIVAMTLVVIQSHVIGVFNVYQCLIFSL